jgi:hypothetical protein
MQRTGERIVSTEWLDCYFLPWSRGRTTRMVLDNGARYFFTATMNGCSFLVSGPANGPTVSHLNTAQPGDDLPDADVTKATIKGRYATAVGTGTAGSTLLTKYKAPATFLGRTHRYKEQAGEIGGIGDPDIVPLDPTHPYKADINTFLVGVRDPVNGWEFFYQRAAVLPTFVDKPQFGAFEYHRKSAWHALRSNVGSEHKWKIKGGTPGTVRDQASINHRVTPCQKLNFP